MNVRQSFDEDLRDSYAEYGIAMYWAQRLERTLRIALTVGRVTTGELKEMDAVGRSRDTYSAVPMGTLLARLGPIIADDKALAADLGTALDLRNRFAHKFFEEHSDNQGSASGRVVIVDDAISAQDLFSSMEERLNEKIATFLEQIGEDPEKYISGLSARIDEENAGT